MRDGAAERAFPGGALDVDMDPLVVLGAVREFVDALLVDGDPGRSPDLLADACAEFGG